jgi:hypothetical protein
MNRFMAITVVCLFVICSVQAWIIFSREEAVDPSVRNELIFPESVSRSADYSGAVPAGSARVEAGFTSLHQQSRAHAEIRTPATQIKSLDPQSIAAADRRFASIFHEKEFKQEDMIRLQVAIASLPEDEQYQLMAAFSRAVNSNRIKLRM